MSAVLQRVEPVNCETDVSALIGGTVMPSAHFYVRNHFAVPNLDAATWRLRVGGLVRRPLALAPEDLVNLPSRVETVTLECAGNGRSFLTPSVGGEQWGLGAVSTAEWTGVPLAEILERAGVAPGAREVVFKGADGEEGRRFERSLTVEDLRSSDVMLAYAMNGELLSQHHGFPLRAIVPGWYGVASVKWLTEIDVIGHSFSGYFQTEKYVYEWEHDGGVAKEPVRHQRIRALITQPAPDQVVDGGAVLVRGFAWSGLAPIAKVEVSLNGQAWEEARLMGKGSRHSWRRWEVITTVDQPGRIVVRARATDRSGHTQPGEQVWNRLGYGNNAIQEVAFTARRP